jgi:PAS domain-containing protein
MDVTEEILQTADLTALVTPDGVIRRLNVPMATALGRSVDDCVGHDLAAVLPDDQTIAAERLLALGAMGERRAMTVFVFTGARASLACLFEARPVRYEAGEQLVWIRAVSAENDFASLVIPFQISAEAAGLGLWTYSPSDRRLRWVGGVSGFASFSPEPTFSLPWIIGRVHPDDRDGLRRLMRPPTSVQSPMIELRVLSRDESWHQLACQTRRVELGEGGPVVTFVLVRDETEKRRLADLAEESLRRAEKQRIHVDLATALQERMLPFSPMGRSRRKSAMSKGMTRRPP